MTKVLPFYTVQHQFEKYVGWIKLAVEKTGIDPFVLIALCWQESGFDSAAQCFEPNFRKKYIDPLSNEQIRRRCIRVIKYDVERKELATSWGIMQIMGQTARELGFSGDLISLNGFLGLLFGAKYFCSLLKKYDSLDLAISAYNAGTPTERNRVDYTDPVLQRIEIVRNEPIVQKWLKENRAIIQLFVSESV